MLVLLRNTVMSKIWWIESTLGKLWFIFKILLRIHAQDTEVQIIIWLMLGLGEVKLGADTCP